MRIARYRRRGEPLERHKLGQGVENGRRSTRRVCEIAGDGYRIIAEDAATAAFDACTQVKNDITVWFDQGAPMEYAPPWQFKQEADLQHDVMAPSNEAVRNRRKIKFRRRFGLIPFGQVGVEATFGNVTIYHRPGQFDLQTLRFRSTRQHPSQPGLSDGSRFRR